MPISDACSRSEAIALFGDSSPHRRRGGGLLIRRPRKVREEDHRLARLTFRLSLVAVQAVTICLATASLSNFTC